MADNSVLLKKGNLNLGATAAGGVPTATVTASAPADVHRIEDVLALCQSPSQLSKEGEEYVSQIESGVNSKLGNCKVYKITGANYEARVFECNNELVAMVFAETYVAGMTDQPIAAVKFMDFDGLLKTNGLDPTKVIQFYVIRRADYAKVDKMTAWVTNLFIGESSETIKQLSATWLTNSKFRITTDPVTCRNYIESIWPLATLPRMDSSFLLYSVKTVENAFDRTGRPDNQITPILAVSSYTDFRSFNTGNEPYISNVRKYAPFCSITGIYSRICGPSIAAMGLALSTYMFVRRGCWLKPFTNFTSKSAPDMGKLIADAKGHPAHAASMSDIQIVLDNHLVNKLPFLALDVQIGTPYIPVLKDLSQNMGQFNAIVDAFTCGKGATTTAKTWQAGVYRFDGVAQIVKDGISADSDTRCVDYLQLLASGAPINDATSFLRPLADAKDSVANLKHFYAKAELLYLTNRIILNPAWVDAVVNDLSTSLHVDVEGALDPSTYDIGSLAGFQPMGVGMMPFMSGSAGCGFGNFYF